MITRFLMEMEMESHPEYAQYLQEYNKKAVDEGAKPFKEQLVQASKIVAEVSEVAKEQNITNDVVEVPSAKVVEHKEVPKKKSFPKKK